MTKYWRSCLMILSCIGLLSCEPERSSPKLTVIKDVPLEEFPYVELTSAKGTAEELDKIRTAVLLLNAVYSSPCFEREVLTRVFTETNDLNNQEIYNALRTGTVSISVIMYTGSWADNNLFRTIGYVRPNIPDTIFQNRHFVKDEFLMARNLIHEIAHLRGFNHFKAFSTSVPYQMNEIWDVCSEELGIKP